MKKLYIVSYHSRKNALKRLETLETLLDQFQDQLFHHHLLPNEEYMQFFYQGTQPRNDIFYDVHEFINDLRDSLDTDVFYYKLIVKYDYEDVDTDNDEDLMNDISKQVQRLTVRYNQLIQFYNKHFPSEYDK